MNINPFLTSNVPGSFSVQSDGYIQGMAMSDPVTRNALSGGIIASTETLPMWGGVGIFENINAGSVLGPNIGRALTLASLTGFSVFDQSTAWVNTPQSPVSLGNPGTTSSFYRLGSGARIPLAVDPALISLNGGLVTQQVSWDFNGQKLVSYAPVEASNVLTAMSWASTNGGTVTGTTTTAHGFVPGNWVTISGVAPSAYNGDVQLIAGTTGSTIVYLLPLASTPGAVTTQGQVNAAGGALNVEVLDLNVGNSMVVVYNAVTGFATWNKSGACALVKI